ncbi:MAG: hypothetical protein ACRC6K_00460 [Fusobacteriaceae bacterium]
MSIIFENSYFFIDKINLFDENEYNLYEYVVKYDESNFYALPRTLVNNIFQFVRDNNITLVGIYSSSLFNRFEDSLEHNFFLKEYSKELNPSSKNTYWFFYFKFILIFEIIVVSFFYFINSNILKKIQNTQIIFNNLQQNLLILEHKNNEVLDFSLDIEILKNLIPDEKIKFSLLLKEISSFNFLSLYIDKIEISFPLIKLYGSTQNLQELYLFEKYLEQNNFQNLNNDYIKNTQGIYLFTIDMSKKEVIF